MYHMTPLGGNVQQEDTAPPRIILPWGSKTNKSGSPSVFWETQLMIWSVGLPGLDNPNDGLDQEWTRNRAFQEAVPFISVIQSTSVVLAPVPWELWEEVLWIM